MNLKPDEMTLRDYFAASVAAGDAAAGDGWNAGREVSDAAIAARVRLYYRIADAMLAAGRPHADFARPRAAKAQPAPQPKVGIFPLEQP